MMDDFFSDEGFNSTVWGPSAWALIHIVAANVPLRPTAREAVAYHTFFKTLATVLPCSTCRREYKKLICCGATRLSAGMFQHHKRDPPGGARVRVFEWTIRLHDAVNRRKGVSWTSEPGFWARTYARLRRKKTLRLPRMKHTK
jgi:hypothetical protein